MRLTATLTAALLVLGSTTAFAQTNGATAGEKPGQGTNTGAVKDGMMMKDGKMAPSTKEGAANGMSSGTGEAATPAKPGMAPTPPNGGKGIPDTK